MEIFAAADADVAAKVRADEIRATFAPPEPRASAPRWKGESVHLSAVTKSFGARPVLRRLDLDVPAGQFLAVVGRSGGGKTTLMRLICGLDLATSGTVRVGESPVTGLMPQVRLLFQDARLAPWQRVLANVGIARAAHIGARRPMRRCATWASPIVAGTGRLSCPVDRSSACRWPAPWSRAPACCCWTSHSAPSTP